MDPVKSQPLTGFLGKHAGEVAWLFGKGPSLDLFDFKDAGPIRAAVNDVAAIVPGCRYGFANDDTADWADLYRNTGKDFVLFQPWRIAKTATVPPCKWHVFADRADDDLWHLPAREKAVQGLGVGNGTISSAIQIFQIMGIRKVVCVGIDGGQKHASRNQWRTRLQNDHWRTYARIRQSFIVRARELGIELEFFGAGKTPEQKRGNMKILIVRNTASKGITFAEGEVVELEESEAGLLVACGKAIPAPSAPVNVDTRVPGRTIETATAESQTETPEDLAPKRTKRGRKTTQRKG